MRIIIGLFLVLLIPCVVFSEDNLPFDKSTLEQTYKLDNGNTIYIEQTGMNDAIWEKDLKTNKINKIAHVWSFIALAGTYHGKGKYVFPDGKIQDGQFSKGKFIG